MTASLSTVHVSHRGEDRLRRGHPWIYRSDVTRASAASGDLVAVIGPRERKLGEAMWSDRSQIALRMMAAGEQTVGENGWRERLAAAIAFRESLNIDATAYRLVHGEADRLPALIVDRYADVLVVQALSQGMDRRLDELTRVLVDLLHPKASWRGTIPRSGCSRGSSRRSTCVAATSRDRRSPRRAGDLRRRRASWAEDRPLPRSA